MTYWLQVAAIVLAVVAGALAVLVHQRSAGSPATTWGTRASLLLSLAIVVGTLPALLFPTAHWLRYSGSLLSLFFTVASLLVLRRQRHALRSRPAGSSHD
jgi:hypothetical protein